MFGSFANLLVLSCVAHMMDAGHQPELHNHCKHNTLQTAFPLNAVGVEMSFKSVFSIGDTHTVFKDSNF